MNEKTLEVKIQNEVAFVALNRPQIHNAFNEVMIAEITELFQSLAEKKVRVVVLSGKGKSFCAGADLNWMKRMKDYSSEENQQDAKQLSKMLHTINTFPGAVIAVAHGAILGGGVGLMSCCDYVLALSNTKIGLTEVRLGLLPAVISPYVLSKVGASWGRATFLSGHRFSARDAYHMGLVHEMVDSEQELEQRRDTLVESFLKAAPLAQKAAKQLVFKGMDLLEGQWQKAEEIEDYTAKKIAEIRIGDEAQEGMSALLEKRAPHWMGQKKES